MSFKDSEDSELVDRYDYVIKEYVALATKIAPILEQFGRYRKELQALTVEINDRNLLVPESEELKAVIEETIKEKRDVEE